MEKHVSLTLRCLRTSVFTYAPSYGHGTHMQYLCTVVSTLPGKAAPLLGGGFFVRPCLFASLSNKHPGFQIDTRCG